MVHFFEFFLEKPLVLPELSPDVFMVLTSSVLVLVLAHLALFDVRKHVK